MQFSEFSKQIVKIKNLELPGEAFHLKMAPIQRILELKKKAREMKSAKKAAVLCLFYPSEENHTNFVLILRNTYKGVHSAQIGFPGGKYEDEDNSLEETALREAEEEVGVMQKEVEILKELTEIYIPPSNFFVQPYLGVTNKTPHFVRQEDEVDAIIEVPINEFLNPENLVTQTLSTSYAKKIEVPAFNLQGQVVWGATAMMLNEIRELLSKVL
ncbi:MAG: CoA pyrophosphatase [Flavobacteriaceae bacterium]|nr:CoA pyrophosphatase [Flavobacteriaceae bacterium]